MTKNMASEASLLKKSSSSGTALGVHKFVGVMILATLVGVAKFIGITSMNLLPILIWRV